MIDDLLLQEVFSLRQKVLILAELLAKHEPELCISGLLHDIGTEDYHDYRISTKQQLQPDNGDYTNTNKLEENEMDFEKELEVLINKHSKENESDTPDFILAQYLKDCMTVYAETIKARDKWYGFKGLSERLGI